MNISLAMVLTQTQHTLHLFQENPSSVAHESVCHHLQLQGATCRWTGSKGWLQGELIIRGRTIYSKHPLYKWMGVWINKQGALFNPLSGVLSLHNGCHGKWLTKSEIYMRTSVCLSSALYSIWKRIANNASEKLVYLSYNRAYGGSSFSTA